MPHLIIEFSDQPAVTQKIDSLLDAVHQAAVDTALFDESHIRIRAHPVLHYRIGGETAEFIYVQCRIHSGRNDAQKRQLSEAILAVLREHNLPVSNIAVEVVEMEKASYAKWAVNRN